MSHIDPIHLERLPRDQISELAEIAIAEGNSRSIVGLGPIWDLIRGVEVLSWGLNRGLDIFAAQPWWLVFPALAVFGAILASYADQLGWRLARLEDAEDFGVPLSDGEQKLVRSKRSLCPPCGRRIAFYDNIPIVSWLTLRGRCRCGATAIPRRHLVSEVLGALLLPALFLSFGATTTFLAVVVYATLAGAGSLADLERRILPNRLNYSILWIGLAFAAVSPASRGHDALAHWLRAPLEVADYPCCDDGLGGWIFSGSSIASCVESTSKKTRSAGVMLSCWLHWGLGWVQAVWWWRLCSAAVRLASTDLPPASVNFLRGHT